jgi:hypothetical protein
MQSASWLEAHAAAVQALASVCALIITAALAVLTAWYVRLTRSIAAAATEQVKHLKESTRAQRQRAAVALEALSRRVRVPLAELVARGPSHRLLLDLTQLNQQDIAALEAIAQDVSETAIRFAGRAAFPLRTLDGIIQQAKSVNVTTGWVPTDQQTAGWREAVEAAPKLLEALDEACRDAAA